MEVLPLHVTTSELGVIVLASIFLVVAGLRMLMNRIAPSIPEPSSDKDE